MPFEYLPFLKKAFTPWHETLEESFAVIETDFQMFAFICNFVIANCGKRKWDFGASRSNGGQLGFSFSDKVIGKDSFMGVWNHVYLDENGITWRQNMPYRRVLTGAEEIKAFIRSLHEQ